VEWNKRTADISERVNNAEMPLVIAAPGLRTTIVDILLRNLVRNSGLDDARRKYGACRCGAEVRRVGHTLWMNKI
jgi:hypothetical protein